MFDEGKIVCGICYRTALAHRDSRDDEAKDSIVAQRGCYRLSSQVGQAPDGFWHTETVKDANGDRIWYFPTSDDFWNNRSATFATKTTLLFDQYAYVSSKNNGDGRTVEFTPAGSSASAGAESLTLKFMERSDDEFAQDSYARWDEQFTDYIDPDPNERTITFEDYKQLSLKDQRGLRYAGGWNSVLTGSGKFESSDSLDRNASSTAASTTSTSIPHVTEGFKTELVIDPDLTAKLHAKYLNVWRDRDGHLRIGSVSIAYDHTEDTPKVRASCVKCGWYIVAVQDNEPEDDYRKRFTYAALAHGTNHAAYYRKRFVPHYEEVPGNVYTDPASTSVRYTHTEVVEHPPGNYKQAEEQYRSYFLSPRLPAEVTE